MASRARFEDSSEFDAFILSDTMVHPSQAQRIDEALGLANTVQEQLNLVQSKQATDAEIQRNIQTDLYNLTERLRLESESNRMLNQKRDAQMNQVLDFIQTLKPPDPLGMPRNRSFRNDEGSGSSNGTREQLDNSANSRFITNAVSRLEFPRFDGTNPKSWVFKCHKYFSVVTDIPEM